MCLTDMAYCAQRLQREPCALSSRRLALDLVAVAEEFVVFLVAAIPGVAF